MLVHEIRLTNFLSFGPKAEIIELKSLNIMIGPNGSGKSNLLESIDLLRNAPDQFLKPIREGGGIQDWLWKGEKKTPAAIIDAILTNPKSSINLRYVMSFTEVGQRFERCR